MGLPVPPANQLNDQLNDQPNDQPGEGVTVVRNDETGAVTAETAVALPLVALFAVSMAWLVSLGITQVRVLDAARETARSAARSDSGAEAVSLGRRVAPTGSRIVVRHEGHVVVATVSSPVSGPAGLFGSWSAFRVRAEAVAAQEPTQ